MLSRDGMGIEVVSTARFSASALKYSLEQLDCDGPQAVKHPSELAVGGDTYVHVDMRQTGVGCVNSWGALPIPKYMLPYGDYLFEFVMRPYSQDYLRGFFTTAE